MSISGTFSDRPDRLYMASCTSWVPQPKVNFAWTGVSRREMLASISRSPSDCQRAGCLGVNAFGGVRARKDHAPAFGNFQLARMEAYFRHQRNLCF